MKTPIVLLLAGALPAAGITITDNFNDGVIDTSIWNASTPFSQSQVFEENGSAVLIARGGLQTIEELPGVIRIEGRFKLTNPLYHIELLKLEVR